DNALHSFRSHPNEWIVRGVNDQGGNGNAIDQVRCRGARVIVVGAGESAVVSSNTLVEETEAGYAPHARHVEMPGKRGDFAFQPAIQLQQKIPFINAVGGLV